MERRIKMNFEIGKFENINYCGTREQWEKITKATEWDDSTDGAYNITYEYTDK